MKRDSAFFCFLNLRTGVAQLWPHSPFPGKVTLCDSCLSVPELDLVEKQPCSLHSGRVCECRPGLFCQLSVQNTCTRCQPHSACRPGFGVKTRGRNSFLSSHLDLSCSWPWAWTWFILFGRPSVVIFVQAPQPMMSPVSSALLGPSLIKAPAQTPANPTPSKSVLL